jgi:endoglucanase
MWKINEQEYFESAGHSLLVFHNTYQGGKQGGIEIIQFGERIATNGGIYLESTPGQWSPLAVSGKRNMDVTAGKVSIPLRYEDIGLDCVVNLVIEEAGLRVCVDLAQPLPEHLVGQVGFNIELFPTAFVGKTYFMGETSGIFPLQANGPVAVAGSGKLQPQSLAEGKSLIVAPEDQQIFLKVESTEWMSLYDGRNTAHNGWFVVRSLFPSAKTGCVVNWLLTMGQITGWKRQPVICISQVGYHPDQEKRAVLELDPDDQPYQEAVLQQITPQGFKKIIKKIPQRWGRFLRYEYGIFDFSSVTEPGIYRVNYGETYSSSFSISKKVYQENVWQPTLETFLPVQMCHMEVRDRSQVWHGACHLDDALQAPVEHIHFDGYRQGAETETPYPPLSHIPGLDRGGWHDAGDYDLAAGSQAVTTHILSLVRETFQVNSDQTTVDREKRFVQLHKPDGKPDILQQVVHGVENLLSGYHAVGHSFSGIIEASLEQYTHLGDASTMTDNRIYDPTLAPHEVVGGHSGKQDDRWAFTNHDTGQEYQVAAALAAASRVLRGFENSLALECLDTAEKIWEREQNQPPVRQPSAYVPRNPEAQEVMAGVELWLTTGKDSYRRRILDLIPVIEQNIMWVGWQVARALHKIGDERFLKRFTQAAEAYQQKLDEDLAKNPFGIPFHSQIWGIGWNLQSYAVHLYFLLQAFPRLFRREAILRVLNYVLGCHPGSDVSLVSGVGARSLDVAYGTNRADWSYIPGGVASGPNLVLPDFPEMKYPFPFLWQQTEYVIGGAATYIFCVLAADQLLNSVDKQ